MTFFKELIQTVSRVNALEVESDADIEVKQQRLEALNFVVNFVKSGAWTSQKSVATHVLYALRFGVEAAASKYKTSLNAMSVKVTTQSTRIRERLGFPVLEEMEHGDYRHALWRFKVAMGCVSLASELPQFVIDVFPEPEFSEEALVKDDLVDTAHILRTAMVSVIKERIEQCDQRVLAQLLYLLNSNSERFMRVKLALLSFLFGQTDAFELERVLSGFCDL